MAIFVLKVGNEVGNTNFRLFKKGIFLKMRQGWKLFFCKAFKKLLFNDFLIEICFMKKVGKISNLTV